MSYPRTTQTPSFKVTQTSNLPAPFPTEEDRVEVEMIHREKALVHIFKPETDTEPIVLEGSFDRERRMIVGEYGGFGSFEMTVDESETLRERPNGRRRVRCEIHPDGREPEPGCWIAEEDDPCCRVS